MNEWIELYAKELWNELWNYEIMREEKWKQKM